MSTTSSGQGVLSADRGHDFVVMGEGLGSDGFRPRSLPCIPVSNQVSTAIVRIFNLAVRTCTLFIVLASASLRAQTLSDEALRHMARGH